MKILPILTPELTPLERERPRVHNPECSLCTLKKGYTDGYNQNVCVRPILERGKNPHLGTLLVIGEAPNREEDASGLAFTGKTSKWVRALVQEHWTGDVVYDLAMRCQPPAQKIGKAVPKNTIEQWVRGCRGYLAGTMEKIGTPNRILCLGQSAYFAVTGRSISPLSMRRGWGWLTETDTPVYMVQHPGVALSNRFYKIWFQNDLKWALSIDRPPVEKQWDAKAYLVENAEDALVAEKAIRESKSLTVDCEWFGAPYDKSFRLMTVGITAEGQKDSYAWTRVVLKDPTGSAVQTLKGILQDPNMGIYGQYIKADAHGLYAALGIYWFPGFKGDTQVWSRLMETEARADLEAAAERVGMGGHKQAMQLAIVAARKRVQDEAQRVLKLRQDDSERALDVSWGKKRGIKRKNLNVNLGLDESETYMEAVSTDQLKAITDRKAATQDRYSYGYVSGNIRDPYCVSDTLSSMRLAEYWEARLARDPQITNLWNNFMQEGVQAIWRIENAGVPVQREVIYENIDYFRAEITRVMPRISKYNNCDPAKNNDIINLLYNKLHLPIPKLTKHGTPAVDEEALDALREPVDNLPKHEWPFLHPVIPDLLAYRGFSKYLGTYSEGMLNHVRDDQRIHPNIKPDVARSGRLACSDPALHGIPSAEDDPASILIRNMVVVPPGYIVLKSDFSQLEYKGAAFLSGDQKMKDVFIRGEDVHTGTTKNIVAPYLWKIPAEDWDKQAPKAKKDQRKYGKVLNFGDMFGMGAKAMAASMGVEEDVAKQLKGQLSAKYPDYTKMKEREVRNSHLTGFSRTMWWDPKGDMIPFRKRMNQGIGSDDKGIKSKGERIAVNSHIQGWASDLCLWAMIRLWRWIDANEIPCQIILTIHDALFFLVKAEYLEEVAYFVKYIMEDYYCGGVPITVDMEIGESWGIMASLKPWMFAELQRRGFQAVLERYREENK